MFKRNDDMVECPYDSSHRMLRKRLQTHLIKCRLQHTDVEFRKCPFNVTHLIPEPEYAHHATNCPDRKLITQYKFNAPEPKEEETPKHAPIDCDENWDDTDVNDYNPQLHLGKAKVLLKPEGVNRSERKLFRKQERERLGDGDVSSDEESKCGFSSSEYKRQRDNNYDLVKVKTESCNQDSRSDKNYLSTSPSSSYRANRSRSPVYKSSRSRSPADFDRSHRDGRCSYQPASNYNSSKVQFYKKDGRIANNDQYNSGREIHYSEDKSSAYNHSNSETNPTMAQAPPPPVISYPALTSYRSASYTNNKNKF